MSPDASAPPRPDTGKVPEALVDPLPPETWVFDDSGPDETASALGPGDPTDDAGGAWKRSLLVGVIAFAVTAGVIGLLIALGPMAGAVAGCGGA
jgi:hypothetical protein